jgi:hypothetical protein
MNDGRTENRWSSDPNSLQTGRCQHIAVNVDGGPKIVTFIIDGRLCDGGATRRFGWGRFSPNLRDANGGKTLRIAPSLNGRIDRLRLYDCCLRTSEVIGNWRAGTACLEP